jgi:hypothetical protein
VIASLQLKSHPGDDPFALLLLHCMSLIYVFLFHSSITSGCSVGTTIVTAGGGKSNFVAMISQVNDDGAILTIEILNHGEGIIMMPSVAVNDPQCMCNFEVQ